MATLDRVTENELTMKGGHTVTGKNYKLRRYRIRIEGVSCQEYDVYAKSREEAERMAVSQFKYESNHAWQGLARVTQVFVEV